MLKPRNYIARSPLLRKGGVHQRSLSAQRRDTKRSIEQALSDWQADDIDDKNQSGEEPTSRIN